MGEPAPTIRRVGVDAPAMIHELWLEYAREVASARLSGWSWTWKDVLPRLPAAAVFVAEHDGEPVGFAIASRSRVDVAHVDDLYVKPAHRRRGIATALLRAIADALAERGVRHLALDVDLPNRAAAGLYEAAGFSPYATRLAADVTELRRRLRER